MGLFFKRKNKESASKTPVTEETFANTLTILDKSGSIDDMFINAIFENGEVYCKGPYETFCVGYYSANGENTIVLSKNRREIGSVNGSGSSSMIYLSNAGYYKYLEETGIHKNIDYTNMIFCAGEVFDSGVILDKDTYDTIASFTGDMIGAAAAYICLQYECSSSGKCHDFFYNH